MKSWLKFIAHSMSYNVVCLFLVLLLSACTPARYKPLTPPLVHYTPQEEKQVADELRSHPDLKEIPVMLRDYGNERAEIRVSAP